MEPTVDNVLTYAEIVQDKHQARKLMLASNEIHEKGYEDGLEVRDGRAGGEALFDTDLHYLVRFAATGRG